MKGRIGVCPHLHRGLSPSCPDPSYKLNCYPTKMHSALIKAMVGYARLRPARRAAALDLARKAADYLISLVGAEGSNAGLDAARTAWEEN